MMDGMSSTKDAQSYMLEYFDKERDIRRIYRFIDTAGVGDTDGSDEDTVNRCIFCQNIIFSN